MYSKHIFVLLLLLVTFLPVNAETVDGNVVYIDDENAYLSAYPHTISSSGYVYFNLTPKQFTGDIDAVWLFNTTVAKPSKPERYNPHWENTTSQHSHTFYNVSSFTPYEGDVLDYGNDYNTNYSYTAIHEIIIYNEITGEPEGSYWQTSNASFDYFETDGVNYTIYWHNRHDLWVLWSDFSEVIEHQVINYNGWTDAYLSKDLSVTSGVNYQVRVWVEVPVSLSGSYGKYCFAVKPSSQTLGQAVSTGTLYVLDPWWNSSWTYYKTLTINQSMVNQSIGTGTFPMLVSIKDADLADHAQIDGDDIVFTDSSNSTLPHEIEYWNKTSGILIAWVNITDIKNVESINMYYNNSEATNTENSAGVWGSDYLVVYHYNENELDPDSIDIFDSSENELDGNSSGMTSADLITGKIDGGFRFDDQNNLIDTLTVEPSGTFSVMFWLNDSFNNLGWIYDTSDSGGVGYAYTSSKTIVPTSGTVYIDGSPGTDIGSYGVWRHVVVSGTTLDIKSKIRVGNSKFTSSPLAAWLDEFKIYRGTMTGSYIETNYNNTAFPELFISVGSEQSEEYIPSIPEITLVNISPQNIFTNYTGEINISYNIHSETELNLSSLAFLYGINYTINGDMYNFLRVPNNNISYDGIYRAPYRNTTPQLSWENNNTITEGNVWKWGGGDNDSTWISTSVINETDTWLNITGYTQDILPQMYYISRSELYNAPKTQFEINRQQAVIFKTWDIDGIRGRDHDHTSNLYFDTMLESTIPTYPLEIGYCNNSYNPEVDDFTTCEYCEKLVEVNSTVWMNHTWDPSQNSSYSLALSLNESSVQNIEFDDVNYIWLRSYCVSSKSYELNATNYDPGITNITFANTNTMWTYNELSKDTTPVSYTPSVFITSSRDYLELLHHVYISDVNGTWGHSEIYNETIGASQVPVSPVSFDGFNTSYGDEYVIDTYMDATYNSGELGVLIHAPGDPDGGSVSHNLTIHYSANNTIAGILNNSFETTGTENIEIVFDTTPYYTNTQAYKLRCVSIDDEGSVATKWLNSNFTLDYDGSTGWVYTDKVRFWGYVDIPTLYTAISNESLLSYDGINDVYTMHVPFFKSKYNDTFTFSECVHLKSNNLENVSYFRFLGTTIFDNAEIYGWDTIDNELAPITDIYRAYVIALTRTNGNITNSTMSNLGYDSYRMEGVNFVDNIFGYVVYNSTFNNNAEGIIFEYCDNINLSYVSISDSDNVGIGVYYTNNTVIEYSTIENVGGRGITLYEALDSVVNFNTVTNSGIHGVHYWSNSNNNSCIGNEISGSALYDYYLTGTSIDNFIIDPSTTTNTIRIASTSSVSIINTDNYVFSENGVGTTYAYPSNFSIYLSGTTQTVDITQHDMTIVPSNDNIAVSNFDWGPAVSFSATSEFDINNTWFNITNPDWSNKEIYIYRNSTDYSSEIANVDGSITFYYTDDINYFFEFKLYDPAWIDLENSITWAISISKYLVSNIGVVIVTAFSLICIIILMTLIGMALSITNIIFK